MLLNHSVLIWLTTWPGGTNFVWNNAHTVKRKITNMLLMFDWTCLLSFAQKTTFFTERTIVWFVDCNKFVFGCGICCAVILSSKQKLMQMCISFKSASKKPHLTCKEVKTCWEEVQQVTTTKVTSLIEKIATVALRWWKLYYLLVLVPAVTLGTLDTSSCIDACIILQKRYKCLVV